MQPSFYLSLLPYQLGCLHFVLIGKPLQSHRVQVLMQYTGCRQERGGMHPQHPKEAPGNIITEYMEGDRGLWGSMGCR